MLALAIIIAGASRQHALAEILPAEYVEGQSVILRAEVEGGEGPFTFQWRKNHVPILGVTGAELNFPSLQLEDAGAYAVTVLNDFGYATSLEEVIVVRQGRPSRLANVSVSVAAREPVMVGFTLGGNGTSGATELLARAAGPALAQFGVIGALRDPVLSIYERSRLVSRNDDWDSSSKLISTAAVLGAFPFGSSSKDAAIALSLQPASYTAEVVDATEAGGITVIELYDATLTADRSRPRLLNVSARGNSGAGDSTLTAGFTIDGDVSVAVLLRGIGPSLTRFGLAAGVDAPRLTLFKGATLVSSTTGWSGADLASIRFAQKTVGAIELEPESGDAALLTRLRPGTYTAQLAGASAGAPALIEVYEVP